MAFGYLADLHSQHNLFQWAPLPSKGEVCYYKSYISKYLFEIVIRVMSFQNPNNMFEVYSLLLLTLKKQTCQILP